MNDANSELLKAFYGESSFILEQLDSDLQRMETEPNDSETINSIFRGVHTIKGNSSFLSLENVTKLAHAAETLLDKARRREIPVSAFLLEIVKNVVDLLKRLIIDQENELDVSGAVAEITSFLQGGGTSPGKSRASASVAKPSSVQQKIATTSFVRVDEAKITKIISLVSELELVRYSLEKIPEKMDSLGSVAADMRFEVDLQVAKLSSLALSLSGLVFGVRLVPVNQVFQRFPRVVSDLAGKLNKEINLEIVNGDAELDKAVVEAIADPMTHLIRNSADHGIESPQERENAGKPKQGTIRLNSFVRGNFVYIEISDDGRGIDGEKILQKAVEKGIVPVDKVSTFNESKKLALIFAPGFSTAEKVTDISGRGVGMDVVKSNINKLKGTVIIDSKVGRGTVIQLRFPMSIVVLFSLLVEVNHTCCAIPMSQIDESVGYISEELLPSPPADGEDPGKYLALYSLRSLLWGVPEEAGEKKKYLILKFKEQKSQQMAFIIDEFSSIEETVVHSVDSYIAALPGIQGATIRKDGSVGLVLNTESIVELASKSKPLAYVKEKVKVEQEEPTLTDFLRLQQTG